MQDDTAHADQLGFVGANEQELWEVVQRADPDYCEQWNGAVQQDGVPLMKFRGRRVIPVRRLIWALFKKGFPTMPWARGRIMRTCKNKRCINPHHMKELKR